MSAESAKLLLFGDENVDKQAALHTVIAHSSTSTAVRKFLHSSFEALKEEAEKFSPGELAEVETFQDILDLAELSLDPDQVHDVVAAVVVSITRVAELIL